MIRNLINQILILIPTFFAILFMTLLWNSIEFEFLNPNEIIGYYSIFEHSELNDNFRYIFFVGLPLTVYLFTKVIIEKIKFSEFLDVFILSGSFKVENQISKKYLIILCLIPFCFLFTQNFNNNFIDLFHEGQALSGALNSKISNQLWSNSFIITGLFVDILNAKFAWSIFGVESISSYRFVIKILMLITASISFIFLFQILNSLNLNKNLKTFFFIIFCFYIFTLFKNHTLGYRELPIFIFLICAHKILLQEKNSLAIYFILGMLPILGLLWSLDRGIFIIAGYFPFYIILFFNKKYKDFLLINIFLVTSLIFFIYKIGISELNYFFSNSIDILGSSDLLNGIIHPTPFSEMDGSSRATKSLLIIIVNGIILINLLTNKNSNLKKNFKIYIVLYFIISLIFYKIGVTRSDGGHIKQGVSLSQILLVYFVLLGISNFLKQKKYMSLNKGLVFGLINLITITFFIIENTPKNFKYNLLNFKERLSNYINTPNKKFLKKNEIILIKELDLLLKNEKCIQVFTYETAISYYLKKPTCTKFYHIMNMGPKKNQFRFIEELKNSNSNYIITGGTYKNIANIKGDSVNKLSPEERFPYIHKFIQQNYSQFEKITSWNILKKKN